MSKILIKNEGAENVGFVITPLADDPTGLDNISAVESNTIVVGDKYISACLSAESPIREGYSPNSGAFDIKGTVAIEIDGEVIPYYFDANDVGAFFDANPQYRIAFERQIPVQISCDGATNAVFVRNNTVTNTYGKVTVNGIYYSNIAMGTNIVAAIDAFKMRAAVDGLEDEFIGLNGNNTDNTTNAVYNNTLDNLFRVMFEVESGDPLDLEIDPLNTNPTLSIDNQKGVITFCLSEDTNTAF